jgi:hypothetical protein
VQKSVFERWSGLESSDTTSTRFARLGKPPAQSEMRSVAWLGHPVLSERHEKERRVRKAPSS